MKAVECSRNTGSSRKETIHLLWIYIYKLEWQKDLQQTSSHVLLFNTDVSPFGQNLDKKYTIWNSYLYTFEVKLRLPNTLKMQDIHNWYKLKMRR